MKKMEASFFLLALGPSMERRLSNLDTVRSEEQMRICKQREQLNGEQQQHNRRKSHNELESPSPFVVVIRIRLGKCLPLLL